MVILMRKSNVIFILTFIYLINVLIEAQSGLFHYSSCSYPITYNPESRFQANLNAALSSLANTNSGFGFYNSSVGDGIDIANAISLCRGDLDRSTCESCLNDSIVNLYQNCPNGSKAFIVYDNCFLRYSNETILGNIMNMSDFSMWSIINTRNTDRFNNWKLRALIVRLINEAAAGGSLLKFATGNTSVTNSASNYGHAIGNMSETNSSSIYGLVQCYPDLSREQCNACLVKSMNEFIKFAKGSIDARIVSPSCTIRYSNVLFYNDTRVIPTSFQPTTSVSSPSTSPQSGIKLWFDWFTDAPRIKKITPRIMSKNKVRASM